MNEWREKFIVLNDCLPEAPREDANISHTRNKLNSISRMLYYYVDGALLINEEPKIIIKVESTPYQKQHFNENYTFMFQSLLTGRVSQFIPLADREDCGIDESDRNTGGIYPNRFDFSDNISKVEQHYWDIRKKLMNDYWLKFNAYLRQVNEIKGEWWDIYTSYLQSDDWKDKREQRLKIDNYACYICGSDQMLQSHHMHYKNVGDEDMNDLITVCISCHQKLHPYKKIV